MLSQADLLMAFSLPPRRAIEYFRAKGYQISWAWEEVWAQANTWAFTVAKAMNQDILEMIRTELQRVLDGGLTFEEFRRNLEPKLRAAGWWGRKEVTGPTGEATMATLGTVRRLETIYRTNTQTAYQVGRWRAFEAGKATHPYLQYIAVMDSATRPTHGALNNRVFRFDDPVWKYIAPPNGFNCRCRLRALSPEDMQRKRLALSESGQYLTVSNVVDAGTGMVYEQASYQSLGMKTAFRPDKGWSYNPGMDWKTPFKDRLPV